MLIVATGNRLDFDAVAGLTETLGKNGVTSYYRRDLVPYTWVLVRSLKGVPDYIPEVQGEIRVPELAGLWKLSPRGDGRTEGIYEMRGEPGGSVPSWLANSFVVDAPLETLRTLRAVAERQGVRAPSR